MTSNPPPIRVDLAQGRRRRLTRRTRGLAAIGLALLLVLGLGMLSGWKLVFADLPPTPDKAALWSLNRPPGVTFLDKDGAMLAVRGPRHGQVVVLGDMPAYLPRAFLAAEDRRFYAHHGVDLEGVGRAAWADVNARHVVQGGSTITQQVVRNIFLSSDQTWKRKLQEAALAWRIEGTLSKDEILELYLNRIYFGDGAYGVEAAAQTYFGKSARTLTLSEAALLAALPKAPSRLDPANDLDAALARSRIILGQMRQDGWITDAQRQAAIAAPPKLAPEKAAEGDFGYVLDLAASRARDLAHDGAPDLIVRLTVDPKLQAVAAQAVREGVAQGARQGATQAALVALSPDGAIRALVGGKDHRASAFNRATQAMRQPGSAFKPFVYAAALEAGVQPGDVRNDAPVNFHGWSPGNYGGHYSGSVTVADALARSINTVAVKLTHQVGADKVAALAQRFGLSMIPAKPNLSIGLGAYEVDLLDLVSGYQVFQQDGRHPEPYLIETIINAHGDVLYKRPDVPPQQVYDQAHNRLMVKMMQGVIAHGTGRKADIGRPAAGKTGTSQTWRDAWFVGFTPDWIAGVWVGDDRSRPMAKVAGGELPAEIWRRFMLAAHADTPVHDFPPVLETTAPQAPIAPLADHMDETDEPDAPSTGPEQPGPSTPPPKPPPANSRESFYSGLADDFGQAAGEPGPRP
ncbi:transglycosylase domain-containing protein [Caulobacter sp. S45]|uniref:transglycosylase domain-containing protein n=1 Tax=Caulobacter sp. S45 TaxID=1641861 RepID=UPI00131C6E7E|nr:PBP1A family penicillin-binding protein [Caulobacter sp. S45]